MDDKIQNLISLFKTASPKRTFAVLGLLLVALAIPFTANLALKQQNLEQEASERDGFCADVLTPAKNINTGECQTFPNACIPDDFMPDSECDEETAPPSESEESDSVCGNGVCETGEETVFCADPSGSISLGTDMSQFGCFPACRVDCSSTAEPNPTRTPKQDDTQNEERDIEDPSEPDDQNDKEDVDIIDNDQVDLLDYNVLISCSIFGKDNKAACRENLDFEKRSDINKDGRIDQDDYNIFLRLLLRAFGLSSLPVITTTTSPTPFPTPTPTTMPISGNQKILCDGKTFDGWSNSPFEFKGSGDDANGNIQKVIRNCKFLNTADRGIPKPAIFITRVDNLLIENSVFDNIRTHVPGDDVGAIKFNNSGATQSITNVTIRNNIFDGIGSDGVQIGDLSPRSSNILIEGNEFIGYQGTGENSIDIKSTDGPIVIRNNVIRGFQECKGPKRGGNQDCSGSPGTGLVIHTGDHLGPLTVAPKNVTVEGNRFENNIVGITVSSGTNIVLRNNIYINNGKNCLGIVACN